MDRMNFFKDSLGLVSIKSTGESGGGCISSGNVFDTNNGKIFIKENSKVGAKIMFDGEFAGLNAIVKTNTIKVPQPVKVFSDDLNQYIAMEYLEMRSLIKSAADLGEKLAMLHKQNEEEIGTPAYVAEFGFDVPTCCGFIPMDNSWKKDWVDFYVENRLQSQLDLIEKKYRDKDARNLWPQVKKNIHKLFENIEIKPALLHGDLWSGNVAETSDGPCIFDCAAFYGHYEYDLGIAAMFGGFPRAFYNGYHKILPKQPGFDARNRLYQLFHYLNHWNHFGSGYKSSSISIMKYILTL